MKNKNSKLLAAKTKSLRRDVLAMVYGASASHIGSSLSIIDILWYLYSFVLKIDPRHPQDPSRDRFILSKGWAAAGLYAVLAEKKFFPRKWLGTYCKDGSKLIGITTVSGVPGIEATTGSMGHGLPLGVGMAVAGKKSKKPFRVFVVVSDGELDEGSTWEAIFFAGFHKLDNLVVIVDYNKLQSFGKTKDVLDPEPMRDKFEAFRWAVREMKGHDFDDMDRVMSALPFKKGMPSVIIAHTTKGKGVSFMENNNEWHYRPPDKDTFAAAMKELSP